MRVMLSSIGLLSLLLLAGAQPFTYQGLLKASGNPANGNYSMTFRLFSVPAAGAALATVGPINVPVNNGLFTVELNFGSVWTGADRYLEIQVGATTLSPRVKINPTPYAIRTASTPWSGLTGVPAGFADNVDNDTTYSAGAGLQLSGATFSIASGGVVTGMLADLSVTTVKIADGAVTSAKIADGTIATADIANAAVTAAKLSNSGGADGQALIWTAGGVVWGNPTADSLILPFSGSVSGGVAAFVVTHTGTADAARFTVNNASSSAECVEATSNGTGNTFQATATGTGRAGYFQVNNAASGGEALYATTNGTGNAILAYHTGTAQNAGDFHIANASNGAAALYAHTDGTGQAGYFQINNASNSASALYVTTNGTGNGIYVEHTGSSNNAIDARITNASSASAAIYCETDGTGLALWANGTARVDVLEITGADFAEKFPTTDAVEPGMVVEIDPDTPGNLRKARGAYNKRVAGVVAGANGLSKGIVLGNMEGSEKHTPIAISGRVWVYADATKRAIEPGDLLTTSDKPGYAMAASDTQKAQGAILGKAMTRLEKGKTGMVLVLVNLQ